MAGAARGRRRPTPAALSPRPLAQGGRRAPRPARAAGRGPSADPGRPPWPNVELNAKPDRRLAGGTCGRGDAGAVRGRARRPTPQDRLSYRGGHTSAGPASRHGRGDPGSPPRGHELCRSDPAHRARVLGWRTRPSPSGSKPSFARSARRRRRSAPAGGTCAACPETGSPSTPWPTRSPSMSFRTLAPPRPRSRPARPLGAGRARADRARPPRPAAVTPSRAASHHGSRSRRAGDAARACSAHPVDRARQPDPFTLATARALEGSGSEPRHGRPRGRLPRQRSCRLPRPPPSEAPPLGLTEWA